MKKLLFIAACLTSAATYGASRAVSITYSQDKSIMCIGIPGLSNNPQCIHSIADVIFKCYDARVAAHKVHVAAQKAREAARQAAQAAQNDPIYFPRTRRKPIV